LSLSEEYVDAIQGHKVTIERRPSGATRRRGFQYEFRISGERLSGSWHMTNGQLRDAVNAVCPDFPIRLS